MRSKWLLLIMIAGCYKATFLRDTNAVRTCVGAGEDVVLRVHYHSGQQQSNQDGDDSDHDQQLDQSERAASTHESLLGKRTDEED